MAKPQPLKLSDLRTGVDYPVGTQVQEGRCLFHVKLTDFSMRSIESLINSDKGAFFSLWFAEGGGVISIPGSRNFDFKTAQGEGQGSLECVHQAMDGSKPRLNGWGQIRYKLQVQGTKEVYERTKLLMKETEEQKQKNRTQHIQFPHQKGRSKLGGPTGRPPGRPPGKTSSSTPSTVSTNSSTGSSFSHKHSNSSSNVSTVPGGKSQSASSRLSKTTHTLRERIVHLLAVKPQKRADIVSRLKKETKRGENAMSKIDTLLQEVADMQGDLFYLKQPLYSELQVDEWPFYSEAERQLVRRKHNPEHTGEPLKRTASNRELPPSKRQKLVPPSSFSSSSSSFSTATSTPPPPPSMPPQVPEPLPPPSRTTTSTNSAPGPTPQLSMPLFGVSTPPPTSEPSRELSSSLPPAPSGPSLPSSGPHDHPSLSEAQFPGSVATNFILAGSVMPTATVAETHRTGFGNSQTGLTSSQASSGSGNGSSTGSSERDLVQPPAGAMFGDLLAEPMEVSSGPKKEKKKKKKTRSKVLHTASSSVAVDGKKKAKVEVTTEENGASSTTPSVIDYTLQFPPITSEATRAEYKRIFNEQYQEYLHLKTQIEVVTNEVTALNEQMNSAKKSSEEAKALKRMVREKYTELQQNVEYQTQKRRFQELHAKLSHIKKLVVDYDQSH